MPLTSGLARAIKNACRGRRIFPVRFYIEVYASKGGDYVLGGPSSPPSMPPSSPQRLGGSGGETTNVAGNGGSGIVVIRYPT